MIKLIRLEQTKEGALGSLVLDGELFCTTLEPDIWGDKHQIPVGQYRCRRFHGAKWPDTFEIIVEGHTAVLFHSGNTKEDTDMCVLLGQYPGHVEGKRAVLNSIATFKKFMYRLRDVQEFDLEIVDFSGVNI